MWITHYKRDPFHWFAYRCLTTLIVAGERARQAALKHLSVSVRKLKVVPYGIDLDRASKLHLSRSEAGIPEGFVFGVFSRIDRQKGIKEFLFALEPYLKVPGVYALVVGDPTRNEKDADDYNEEIEAILKRSPFAGRVLRFAARPDYLELLRYCDILVLPSYHESYSLLILDAFMLGLPVISTDSGGTPDLVTSDRGWLCEPRNILSLSRVLERVLTYRGEVQDRGRAAQAYVLKTHSFESVLERLKTIYQ
jgi:glycosyltransferase involved in cell wall biosynthesis